MTNIFDDLEYATKEQSKLRLAIAGPSGSGKTFTALNLLMEMGCERILDLDTEHGSAAKYSGEFARKFKVLDNKFWKSSYDPRVLIQVLKKYGPHVDGIICDSLTHFWMGPGGMLSLVEKFAKEAQARGGKYDSFGAWKQVDPIYNELVQTILSLPCHFVACLRAKTDYDDVVVNGKKIKQKVGMAAQMREGFEYEFDIEGQMTMQHEFIVGKTRCRSIDGMIFEKPGANLAQPILTWLTEGAAPAEQPAVEEPAPETQQDPATAAPEAPESSLSSTLLAAITAAANLGELEAVTKRVQAAKAEKQITPDESRTLLAAWTARKKELTAAA